ncbi:MAG: galactokinase, partial [Patescibacteria group bacterium]
DLAFRSGALGGKLIGAGGGGYFIFYCQDQDAKSRLKSSLVGFGLKEITLAVDYKGARVVEFDL